MRCDFSDIGNLSMEDLCATLRDGSHDVAEVVCSHGAVETTLALLEKPSKDGNFNTFRLATEALWLMIYDFDSCQQLINARGHHKVFRLAREHGCQDSAVACGVFRLLGETLYSEAGNAEVWRTADLTFVVSSLDWALRLCSEHGLTDAEASLRGVLLGAVCNVAALWAWRAQGAAAEAIKALVASVPKLLEVMAARPEDVHLMQHGCRLLHALARRGTYWPDNLREPTEAALAQIATMYRSVAGSDVKTYSGLALKAMKALPPAPSCNIILSAMD